METNNNKIWYFLLFIIFLTSFSLGFFTSKNIEFNSLLRENNFSEEKIVDKIENSLLKKDLDLSLFWQIYNIINNNYYWLDSIDVKETQYWLIKWYVWTLWDKFSEYFTPKENQEFSRLHLFKGAFLRWKRSGILWVRASGCIAGTGIIHAGTSEENERNHRIFLWTGT